jgi:hypothetical protein
MLSINLNKNTNTTSHTGRINIQNDQGIASQEIYQGFPHLSGGRHCRQISFRRAFGSDANSGTELQEK